MKTINFVTCGQVGDLIQQLYAIKAICFREDAKANLYIADFSYGIGACGNFTFDLNKTFEDTVKLISSQKFINLYDILPRNFNEEYVNLNKWRDRGIGKFKTWSDLLSEDFSFEIPLVYKWLDVNEIDEKTKDKVLIHRSNKRHNGSFDWTKVLGLNEEILFITSSQEEYNSFYLKDDRIKPYVVSTVSEMAIAINGCKLFIGNQSMPFTIASGLDIPRVCELHFASAEFYTGEHKYSENISWFLNNEIKHNSGNVNIAF